jgi:hypothetical protein
MYYTHHFAHRETLRRACEWLGRMGFHPEEIGKYDGGIPRLALSVEYARLGEVELLINAVERSDPEGWPSFWDEAMRTGPFPGSPRAEERADATTRGVSEVGWHPLDPPRSPRPNSS